MTWERGGPPRPESERFWEKVEKTDGCWLWTGALTNGYGVFRTANRKTVKTHRYAYLTLKGEPPAGTQLDHLCRVRHCVNPDHLEPVTQAENLRRGMSPTAENARKTHCPTGHAYAEHGAVSPQGYRYCNECRRLKEAAKVAAMTEEERGALRARQRELRYKRLGRGPLKNYQPRT